MRIELVPDEPSVVRFPVERRARPTLDLLRGIAPDPRKMGDLAESFRRAIPDPRVRHKADAAMAGFIANHVMPNPGSVRRGALDELLADAVEAAISACRAAHDASVLATRAQQRVVDAQTEGGYWLQPLEEQADVQTTEAAVLILKAHHLAERAEGAARAIGFARRGETWVPLERPAAATTVFGLTG